MLENASYSHVKPRFNIFMCCSKRVRPFNHKKKYVYKLHSFQELINGMLFSIFLLILFLSLLPR